MKDQKKNTPKKVRKASPQKVQFFVSKAPPPITPVGVSYRLPRPKPTQTKLDWPSYFPNDLIPQATVILCKAEREHPVPTLEFYAQFISNLTPYLCGAVRSKALRTDLVFLGMGVLLDSLLAYNCDDSERRFWLKQELMKSDAWLKLAEKIARVSSAAASDSSYTHLEAKATEAPADKQEEKGQADTVKESKKSPAKKEARGSPQSSGAGAATWDTIEISFLSDERVQIRNGTDDKTYNYAELGFVDSRNGKPNQAWVTLRDLAEDRGRIAIAARRVSSWPKVEKRVQEIRKALRNHFGITSDPFLFTDGIGYQARFKIGLSPSFHT